MKKKLFAGLGALALSLGVVGVVGAEGQSELAQVRQATAKYHDVEEAIKDGYTPAMNNAVLDIPELGLQGTMGLHYINFKELADPSIDPEKPEVLLYVSSKDQKDGVRLVGVEYVVAADDWKGSEAPSVFGQTFEGPMPGHEEGEPAHYDKHVWLWQANPKGFNFPWPDVPGMFAGWNPNIK